MEPKKDNFNRNALIGICLLVLFIIFFGSSGGESIWMDGGR